MRKLWTDQEIDVLKSNYGKLSQELICEIIPNWKYKSIKYMACKLNLTQHRKTWNENELKFLRDNYPICTIPELIKVLNNRFSTGEIIRKARKLNLNKPDLSWTTSEDDYLAKRYLVDKKSDILSNLEKRTWAAIVVRAGNLKLGAKRSGRQYYCDFDYFKEINTEEKAYWLGFIYADGNVSKEGSLRISLVVEGKQQLEKFKQAIKYTGTVRGPYFVSSKAKGGDKTMYTLDIRHKGMCADLATHGVIPNKTFLVKFPKISNELRKHFIRGVFDGDGSISKKITKYKNIEYETPSFSICGGVPEFLTDIIKVIVEETGVSIKEVHRSKIKGKDKTKPNQEFSAWKFGYQGTPALHVRDWMYKEATVWMQCKKDKFFSYDYSSKRPRDKHHQEKIIDIEMAKRNWKRLSEYKSWDEEITIQCGLGHTWMTKVRNFKHGCDCPKCAANKGGERMIDMGKQNLERILAIRGWKLLSEYSSDGDIDIECEHNIVSRMKRRTATQPHAQCDCVRTNSLVAGKKTLVSKLESKGWKLLSEYNGSEEYVVIECQHGKQFSRLPLNVRTCSKCECDKTSSSGIKGVYKQANGRWAARIQLVTGKQKCIGTYATVEEAANAINSYKLEAI